ncbi:hypothetical protein A0J61_11087 [Choanephora cucurbitarum]|uniref:Uncharacterized protein n=1 Tax=Choanephora cucurbitarum TaxID=101091 RepID=A0A1C7N0H2_9FUNG|nr:hypothetical protein A0J61_11087 [Choanephora cucurbitarum]
MERWENNFASFQQVVGRCNSILNKFASTQDDVVTQLQSSIDNRPVLWNERIPKSNGPVLGGDPNKYYQKRMDTFLKQWLGDQAVINLMEELAIRLDKEARMARHHQTLEMHGKAAVNFMIDQAIKDKCDWKDWTYTEASYERRLNTSRQLRTLADISRIPTYRRSDFWLENMIFARYYLNASRKEPQKSARKKVPKDKSDKTSSATKKTKKSKRICDDEQQRGDTSPSSSPFDQEPVSSREPSWAFELISDRQENPLGSNSDSPSPKRRRITESL